jgi:hypothetical protein
MHESSLGRSALDRASAYCAAMSGANDSLPLRNPRIAATVVDLFVYVVVLNLFVEYFPKVLVESFSLSLLTAVLLKVVLEVVVLVTPTRIDRAGCAPRRLDGYTSGP